MRSSIFFVREATGSVGYQPLPSWPPPAGADGRGPREPAFSPVDAGAKVEDVPARHDRTQTFVPGSGRTRPFRFGMDPRPDPRAPLAPGTLVGGRYRIEGIVGEGGMGRVYRAQHVVLGRKVALKILRRDQAKDDATVRRFEQEARAAAAVGHPAIVGIEDFARTDDGEVFLAMELLEGRTLEDALVEGGTLDQALRWIADVADGLAAAHAAGVLHRDVKPGNIFLADTGAGRVRVKILDFGIAKLVDDEHAVHTEMGTVLGTPYYLAPERAQGRRLDPRADLYSLGVILYEILTGNVPFLDASFMGVLAKHMREVPLDPRQAAPERAIPDGIARLTMALLAKDPDDRPQSAAEVAAALEHMLATEGDALAQVPFGPRGSTADPSEPTLAVAVDPGEATVDPAGPWTSPESPWAGRDPNGGGGGEETVALDVAPDPGAAMEDAPKPRHPRRPWIAMVGIGAVAAVAWAVASGRATPGADERGSRLPEAPAEARQQVPVESRAREGTRRPDASQRADAEAVARSAAAAPAQVGAAAPEGGAEEGGGADGSQSPTADATGRAAKPTAAAGGEEASGPTARPRSHRPRRRRGTSSGRRVPAKQESDAGGEVPDVPPAPALKDDVYDEP
ncbi:MAG: serine/threonine protein kinase [Deltaproteobacteria bacterium]|nr:MAG: serine/threonine protein kinase [Deltaproteobacteria bacterium]